jgi:hypothetical protein
MPKRWLIRQSWAPANWGVLGPTADTVPRRKEGARPDRNSFMWNTETPLGTAERSAVGRPQGRPKAQREQKSQEAKAGRLKDQGNE